MLFSLLRVVAPLLLIAIAALWVINQRQGRGKLQVMTSISGAEILLDAQQTGYLTDTTITVGMGRRIVTVRKDGYVSDPEFAVADVRNDVVSRVVFNMKPRPVYTKSDTIPPLRSVRQEIFSTGEPVHTLPPAPRESYPLLDFSTRGSRSEAVESLPSGFELLGATHEPAWSDTVPVSTSIQGTKVTVTSIPGGSEIIVNGAPTPRVTPYTFYGLDRGVYSFLVRRDGFHPRPDSIVLALNHSFQEELAAFELMRDTTLPQPTLTVTTTPLAAAIRINGRAAGVGKVTQTLDFGSHRIEFGEAPGYKSPIPINAVLTAENSQVEVMGTYEKLAGDAFIAVRPGNDFGKFDGSLLRVSVDNELIVDGPQERFDAALVGRVISGKRLVRIQYGDLTGDVHVMALNGEVSEITMRIESFFSKRKLRLRVKSSAIPLNEWQDAAQRMNVLTIN